MCQLPLPGGCFYPRLHRKGSTLLWGLSCLHAPLSPSCRVLLLFTTYLFSVLPCLGKRCPLRSLPFPSPLSKQGLGTQRKGQLVRMGPKVTTLPLEHRPHHPRAPVHSMQQSKHSGAALNLIISPCPSQFFLWSASLSSWKGSEALILNFLLPLISLRRPLLKTRAGKKAEGSRLSHASCVRFTFCPLPGRAEGRIGINPMGAEVPPPQGTALHVNHREEPAPSDQPKEHFLLQVL